MKKIMMLLCAVCLLIGCTSSQKAVKYQVAKNYFFVNNSPYSGLLKITTEQELGKYFGMAATMGKDGQPTEIDFKKQFLIAKILPETDTLTHIDPVSVTEEDNTLHVKYNIQRGEKQSYTMQPFSLLIVDRKYMDKELKE